MPPQLARFGPDYGMRAIALHCRCSRCGSRNVESRPAWPSREPATRGRELPLGLADTVTVAARIYGHVA